MMKNQIIVYRRPGDGRPIIAAVSASREGKVHDRKISDEARMTTPRNIKRVADTGLKGTVVETPRKKPKCKQLTPEQKRPTVRFQANG